MKCEHHEDYLKIHDSLREHLALVEKTLDRKIENIDTKVETSFKKIDNLREQLDEQGKSHVETSTYVKQLYKRFDELTTQMSNIVVKLDAYINAMTVIQENNKNQSAFTKKGKDLVYEIIKWIVIVVVLSSFVK